VAPGRAGRWALRSEAWYTGLVPSQHAHSTTPTSSPYVTLVPGYHHGQLPGDASDPADFYGLLVAIIAIALVIVVVRVGVRLGRRRGQRRTDLRRSDLNRTGPGPVARTGVRAGDDAPSGPAGRGGPGAEPSAPQG
jgi:hypothetical protein